MRKILSFFIFLAALPHYGCSSGPFSIHKIDVQQGNALPMDKIDQLEVGMTPEQVRFLLGYPLVTDLFRPNRWDYVYYFKPGGKPPEERRVTLYFEDGRVVKIERNLHAKVPTES